MYDYFASRNDEEMLRIVKVDLIRAEAEAETLQFVLRDLLGQ